MAEYDHWQIAGWDDFGEWRDVEHGARAPSNDALPYADDLVIQIVDNDGVSHYYHLDGPFDSYDDLGEYVDSELGDKYGGDWA